MNPGIAHWFAADGDALVGYVTRARVRVVAGAPVCAVHRLADVVAEFAAAARAAGERVCYFAAGERLESLLLRDGRASVASLGAQPSWDPHGWPAIVARRASLRAQLNRARNKGVAVERWLPDRAAAERAALERVLGQWLAERPLPPLHFLVEPRTLDGRLDDRRLFVASREGTPVGFLLASPVPARAGWLVEQIIRGHAAPNGTTELMLDAAMRALAAEGAAWVTLGLAPLSRSSRFETTRMPAWLRLALRWVRAHGRRFYDFEGLDRFKTKFEPEAWEEIVAIADAPRFPPRALWAITAAFSDGPPPLMMLRAVARAARQEWRWLHDQQRRRRTVAQRAPSVPVRDR